MLKDWVAIVTGAGRGIGFGIAERLAHEGAHVVIGELVESRGQEAAEKLRAARLSAEASTMRTTRTIHWRRFIQARFPSATSRNRR